MTKQSNFISIQGVNLYYEIINAELLNSGKPLLVFLLATFLSFTHPKFIREKHSMPVLIQKGIGIVLIVIGGVMIVI